MIALWIEHSCRGNEKVWIQKGTSVHLVKCTSNKLPKCMQSAQYTGNQEIVRVPHVVHNSRKPQTECTVISALRMLQPLFWKLPQCLPQSTSLWCHKNNNNTISIYILRLTITKTVWRTGTLASHIHLIQSHYSTSTQGPRQTMTGIPHNAIWVNTRTKMYQAITLSHSRSVPNY